MRRALCIPALFLIVSCAGPETTGTREMAPFHAIVVFQWLEGEAERVVAPGAEPASPVDDDTGEEFAELGSGVAGEDDAGRRQWVAQNRRWIEDEILAGLEEQNVFSDFLPADWENMDELARKTDADLIVVIRIGTLVDWDDAEVSVDPGLAVLAGVLWFGTGVGGLWVEDQVYPTQSDIEVYWRRPREPASARVARPRRVSELRSEFRQRESVYASGAYNLSLWDRAKIWNAPAAYFTNLFMPPSLVPFYDEDEVEQALAVDALEDVKRDLAQKLRVESLRSAGAPFVFRLVDPANGTAIAEAAVDVSFSYRVELGFEDHHDTGLSALNIDVKRQGDREYRRALSYRDEEIERINALIRREASIVESIQGLGPGVNLVRFSAQTARGRQWITNTIALRGP